jgi:hypothetical protein
VLDEIVWRRGCALEEDAPGIAEAIEGFLGRNR